MSMNSLVPEQDDPKGEIGIPLPEDAQWLELWGRSPHNGVWFPIRGWPLSALAPGGDWDQLEIIARCTGQMFQFDNTAPSAFRSSTPQAAEPLHDSNTGADARPARCLISDTETVTVLPATGQGKSF